MNNNQGINNQSSNTGDQNQVNYNNQVVNNNMSYQPVNEGVQPGVNQPNYNNQAVNNNMSYQPVNVGVQPGVNQPNYNNQAVNNNMSYQQQYNNYGQFQNYSRSNKGSKFKNFLNVKNKKVLLKLLTVAIFILVITFVLLNSFKSNRTIMIYMVGSNLEENSGFATYDLEGINYEQLKSNKTKVIVIAGGAKKWNNNYIDVNSTSIYELTSNGYKKVKHQSRRNMGNSSALSGFLNYTYKKYPAKKYDLIFWNHGLGVMGGESDTISGDFLSLTELKSALNNSKFKDNNKLELVLFRTCLNGTIEVADTLKKHANYMVASQEITRAYQGNNVLKVLNTISKADDAKRFGTKFIDAYMQYIDDAKNFGINPYTLYNTYSIIDLSKIDNLEYALNDFFKEINTTSNYTQVAKVRATMLQYASSDDPSYDSIDLYTFVEKIQNLSLAKAQKVLNAINGAVVYSKASDSRSKGLSIYFPYNGAKDTRQYILSKVYIFDGLKDYGNFINLFNNTRTSNNTPISLAGSIINIDRNSESKEADFQLKLTDEQEKTFASAAYLVFKKLDNGSYLPVYSSTDVDIENNTLKANIKDRQLKLMDVSDNSEQILTLIEYENTEDYILYYSLALLSNYSFGYSGDDLEIMQAKIVLKLDKRTNKISLENVYIEGVTKDDNKNRIVSDAYNILAKIEDYKYITLSITGRKILNEQGNYSANWVDDDIVGFQMETKDMKFELEDYNDNEKYCAVFKITDIYGNISYSELVDLK